MKWKVEKSSLALACIKLFGLFSLITFSFYLLLQVSRECNFVPKWKRIGAFCPHTGFPRSRQRNKSYYAKTKIKFKERLIPFPAASSRSGAFSDVKAHASGRELWGGRRGVWDRLRGCEVHGKCLQKEGK